MYGSQQRHRPLQKRVGLVYDQRMERHEHPTDRFHWERPARLQAIYQAIRDSGLFPLLVSIPCQTAAPEQLKLAHQSSYLRYITKRLDPKNIQQQDTNQLPPYEDPDLYANDQTLQAALLAAGSAVNLTKEVLNGHLDSGFALVRPPGHHATPARCMGFCYFNNVGMAAIEAIKTHAQANPTAEPLKVLIVDFDVHEPNGTNALIKAHPELQSLMLYSIHRWDKGKFYPGTGHNKNRNKRVIYHPFNGPQGDDYYLDKFQNDLLPRFTGNGNEPDLILVSAGFDAAEGDPLGQCRVTPQAYYQMIQILQQITPKLVLVLEGGYNLKAISHSAVACLQSLLNLPLDLTRLRNFDTSAFVEIKNEQQLQ